MQLGMIGLGRMGANMVRRLLRGGHQCVVFDMSPQAVKDLVREKAVGADTIAEFVKKLDTPRAIWLMVPAAVVDNTITDLLPHLGPNDILIDGGNSYYVDDIRRGKELAAKGIHYVDVGTSGGVWGLERGYCMMIGGDKNVVEHLDPIFSTLAPGTGDIPHTPGRENLDGTAERGYLHCGPNGAGHFVKMVHNGIEYGLMAAYAEGLSVLRSASVGKEQHATDAETSPLRDPEHYQYDFNLRDIAEVWRRGSVIASWLLDLTAAGLVKDPNEVEDHGIGELVGDPDPCGAVHFGEALLAVAGRAGLAAGVAADAPGDLLLEASPALAHGESRELLHRSVAVVAHGAGGPLDADVHALGGGELAGETRVLHELLALQGE